jgi:hypothetical protein
MNRLLTILLLLGATAHGQINNPPTSVNIVDSTATGRAVLTATNAAAAATAVGLGTANDVTFNRVQVGGATFTADDFSGGNFVVTADHALTFASGGTPGATLTNLGLGTTNNVEFRRLKMIAANASDDADNATLWLDTSGTNKSAAMRLSGTGGGAEKYNAYIQGTAFGLQVSAGNGFRVLSGPTAGVGSVLFAVNSSGNATLNGTANLAPSQTADSGSSLMTRDLSDARYREFYVPFTVAGNATATNGGKWNILNHDSTSAIITVPSWARRVRVSLSVVFTSDPVSQEFSLVLTPYGESSPGVALASPVTNSFVAVQQSGSGSTWRSELTMTNALVFPTGNALTNAERVGFWTLVLQIQNDSGGSLTNVAGVWARGLAVYTE